MNIGLDFGTTNSILGFYDVNKDIVDTYRMDANGSNDYIPSVVAIEDDEIDIGEVAKRVTNDSYYDVYSRFKILLNLSKREDLVKHGFKDRTPREITKIYLQKLIEHFKKDNRTKKIDSLVITVPEIWLKDNHSSRTILKEVIEELKLPLKRMVSEPVSAGAYFLYNFEKENQKKFNGHVLVFDYGGGTLDISLLQTQNNTIRVLERTGTGQSNKFTGNAGVSFDERVIETMCQDKVKKLGNEYRALLNKFESEKIQSSSQHERFILRYIQDSSKNRRIFSLTCKGENRNYLGEFDISASNLIHAFKDLDKEIKTTLREIAQTFPKHNIDTNNSDKFRVVMVGGFSNFYLSKRSVKEFFYATDNDERFETHFKANDIALAIAKGATIIAEGKINIDETFPVNLDLVVQRVNAKNVAEEKTINIFKKGEIVKKHTVSYVKINRQNIRIRQAGNIVLLLDNGNEGGKYKIHLNKNIQDIFPHYNRVNNEWYIGFSIDENSFMYVYVYDKYMKERDAIKTNLGGIIDNYVNSIFIKD
jgi:molecular chaperone DnaK (HSP70)